MSTGPNHAVLVLASASPRRAELLSQAGILHEVISPAVEEAHDASLTPDQLTVANATLKALEGSRMKPGRLVLGADTLVYIDGEPLAKPADLHEAAQMLRRLSGRSHEVCTGVALARDSQMVESFHVITHVTFKPLTDEIIRDYHARVNPLDKAGGYGIQSHTDMLLERMEGSFENVIGLPVTELKVVLDKLSPHL